MNRIRTGDTVIVTTGKSKGYIGKVLKILNKGKSLIVEGANLIKKHIKPNPKINEKGGIISLESPLDASNVAIYNTISKKGDKVGFKFIDKDGSKLKVRYFKSDNELIDLT